MFQSALNTQLPFLFGALFIEAHKKILTADCSLFLFEVSSLIIKRQKLLFGASLLKQKDPGSREALPNQGHSYLYKDFIIHFCKNLFKPSLPTYVGKCAPLK
jgi:hypothetical protein